MTIKQFACLCGCNSQTLRYYDHINLLKPVKVDPWSGYRYYDEQQALTFVKIKNLQSAGFTIEEIKALLDKDNDVIYEAFNQKIAEQEGRLQKIKLIQRSYQNEMSQMKEKLQYVQDLVSQSMQDYDPTEEFGIDAQLYSEIVSDLDGFFESMIKNCLYNDFEFSELPDGVASEETKYLDFLSNQGYEVVYEKHDWKFVKDFLDEFAQLESGMEYALYFEVTEDKENHTAFANTILGILCRRNVNEKGPDNKRKLGCNVAHSKDGRNHFWLLKRK